ncbi:MAG: hypothetical protein ABFE13_12710 [Phycisphaerales bacterium]
MGKIRIRHGENEIELEGSDAFIKKHLDAFYQRTQYSSPVSAPATLKQDIQTSASKRPAGKAPTPAEFFRSKNRTDGISQVLIFGKYLEEYRSQGDFSRPDINKIAAEAKTAKDIHGQYFTNAVKQGLLRSVGRGRYSLTLSAEEALAAMK